MSQINEDAGMESGAKTSTSILNDSKFLNFDSFSQFYDVS